MNNADMPAIPLANDVWEDPSDPSKGVVAANGLTKREHIAAMAMQGILAAWGQHDVTEAGEIASDAVLHADALLAELERTS